MSGTRLTFVNYRTMGEESDRFRARAIHCRLLADAAQDAASRRELFAMALELDEEANRLDTEEPARLDKPSVPEARGDPDT
jgi:hypothetical protein